MLHEMLHYPLSYPAPPPPPPTHTHTLSPLIGFTEAIATRTALENIRQNVRSFIISRSTFPGSGVHTGHWTGDNAATAQDMYFSIPGILSFQMFGVPLVGSDICGFNGQCVLMTACVYITVSTTMG